MKLEVTLTSDEYAALCKAPGRSAPQRMRWLVRFFQAVCEERERPQREAEAKAKEHPLAKLNGIFAEAAKDGILPATIKDAVARPEHWQEKIAELPEYVADRAG